MQIITNYDNYLRGRLKSDNTRRNYVATVKRFVSGSGFSSLAEITPETVTAFCLNSGKNGAGGTSQNAYLAALRSFFQFAHRNGYTPTDFSQWEECKCLSRVKAENRRGIRQFNDPEEPDGKSIPDEHRKLMLSAALKNQRACGKLKSTEGQRNALMLEIGWVCGLRVSDLITLKPSDFNFIAERMNKKAMKTGRKVKFYIGTSQLVERIKKYIEKNDISPDSFLFPTNRSDHMTPAAFWLAFNSILEKAGLPAGKENGGYAPHDLRRTCATELYNSKKMSLKEISVRLGHSTVAMTEKYLRINDTAENIERTKKTVVSVFG